MHPCQHLKQKYHWIHVKSVHEGKKVFKVWLFCCQFCLNMFKLKWHILSVHEWNKSIKCNSNFMYPRQHLKRKFHILDWIHIKSIYEGKKHKVFRIWIGTNILLRSDITWNNIFYQFMNEKSLSNVTLSWCIYVNIWDESIIFWIEYTLYQFMKEKSL